jgi:glycosyltransferase involved in cell wall biosynthesis
MEISSKIRLYKISTVSASLNVLLKGQLAYLNSFFTVIALSSPGEDLLNMKKRELVEIEAVKFNRKISIFRDVFSLINLILVFRKNKPTIIHSITPKAGLLSMIAGKITGVPIRMHTFTGLIFPTQTGFLKYLLILMDKLLCFCATNVYPEGNGVKKDLLSYKITTKPLKVLANGNINGIDLEFFDSKNIQEGKKNDLCALYDIRENDFVFIFVGRLIGDKGLNELVSAFSSLNNENYKLILVGGFEKELDPLLPSTLKLMESNNHIINVGFQEDVRLFFAISHCLVLPSYREGFPNVVLQAGAMGLPSIVTNINGCNEIIEDGINGAIIPAKNAGAIKYAINKMASDQKWYLTLKRNAREMIVSRFEQQMVWDALLNEYNCLLTEKGLN